MSSYGSQKIYEWVRLTSHCQEDVYGEQHDMDLDYFQLHVVLTGHPNRFSDTSKGQYINTMNVGPNAPKTFKTGTYLRTSIEKYRMNANTQLITLRLRLDNKLSWKGR
jgi:hypothetical protein